MQWGKLVSYDKTEEFFGKNSEAIREYTDILCESLEKHYDSRRKAMFAICVYKRGDFTYSYNSYEQSKDLASIVLTGTTVKLDFKKINCMPKSMTAVTGLKLKAVDPDIYIEIVGIYGNYRMSDYQEALDLIRAIYPAVREDAVRTYNARHHAPKQDFLHCDWGELNDELSARLKELEDNARYAVGYWDITGFEARIEIYSEQGYEYYSQLLIDDKEGYPEFATVVCDYTAEDSTRYKLEYTLQARPCKLPGFVELLEKGLKEMQCSSISSKMLF